MFIIGIAGGTGSGKTTLVHQIMNQLPDNEVVIISQDSYYKEIHNDLPTIFSEIFSSLGLEQIARHDFKSCKNKAGINPMVKKYRNSYEATESVILFKN